MERDFNPEREECKNALLAVGNARIEELEEIAKSMFDTVNMLNLPKDLQSLAARVLLKIAKKVQSFDLRDKAGPICLVINATLFMARRGEKPYICSLIAYSTATRKTNRDLLELAMWTVEELERNVPNVEQRPRISTMIYKTESIVF